MMSQDFRNVLLFLYNRWSKEEANVIFNCYDFYIEKWKYSMGEHIWNKWVNACETHHGSLDCIAFFLLELDNSCLQKIIDRSQEYDF